MSVELIVCDVYDFVSGKKRYCGNMIPNHKKHIATWTWWFPGQEYRRGVAQIAELRPTVMEALVNMYQKGK